MIHYLTSMFSTPKAKNDPPRIPKGRRVYAIGDVHGCAELLMSLIEGIEEDIIRGEKEGIESQIILLGDLIDRGPDSAAVIDLVCKWREMRPVEVLFGNHEEMFLESFEDTEMLRHFLRHGGRETLISYGADAKKLSNSSVAEVQTLMNRIVPAKHRKFVESFEDMIQVGDYLFVHAGILPGVPLDKQKKRHLRWIREPFLSHCKSHGMIVVHGHTIIDEVEDTGYRIGIDTGAYSSGRLTALVLEGKKRRCLAAVTGKKGKVFVEGTRLIA
ncbi:MAG: metallophosphoesterase family protein [Alteraurantiacibacter sp. bin_em_oilr2.035]|nr:metallophosphoesterase family protein [Aurantiacibacter atlanticus]MDF1834433.1 metallophosphoesterase family protein [Alteraurantiacibacter sp. bin_em_oilr2.035]